MRIPTFGRRIVILLVFGTNNASVLVMAGIRRLDAPPSRRTVHKTLFCSIAVYIPQPYGLRRRSCPIGGGGYRKSMTKGKETYILGNDTTL